MNKVEKDTRSEIMDRDNKIVALTMFMLGRFDLKDVMKFEWDATERQDIKHILKWRIRSREKFIRDLKSDLTGQENSLKSEIQFFEFLNTE